MDATEDSNLTVSQREQRMVESHVFFIYNQFSDLPPRPQSVMLELARDNHIEYLTRGLQQLPSSFCVLDANRPWLCYWILHSLALLGEPFDEELQSNAIDFLSRCQDPNGGYCGGPGQLPHLATTYAAVNSLVTLGGHQSLSSINREKLHSFLRRMKDPYGGFRMHEGGEMDVRACYTAISVASMLNILDDELVRNVGNYIRSCQTFEGGIGGEPGTEAHGGYTFCGLAAMILINEVHQLDLAGLINWVVFRQGMEGGFQGRTNKLVDGCYSFWQGDVFSLIQRLLLMNEESTSGNDEGQEQATGQGRVCDQSDLSSIGPSFSKKHAEIGPLFQSMALQRYIILCSQVQEGGFRDKPGKARDFYHTCYCLSGLSACHYSYSKDGYSSPLPRTILGPYSNLLEPIHPLYNVVLDKYQEALEFFSGS
ncbi:hypothetical protein V2J09_011646 [Rumex salicifolius]